MTTPAHEPQPSGPAYPDRVYRSPAGIVGGVLLLGIGGWLGIDAVVVGHGRTPWLALATLLLAVPLVAAFTIRPAVYANEERLRIRNPFRVIVLPWSQVAVVRSNYTNEAVSNEGAKFQLWAIPVSLRGRKKAARRAARANSGERSGGLTGGAMPGLTTGWRTTDVDTGDTLSSGDRSMADLRSLHEGYRPGTESETAPTEVTVRWAWEVLGPIAAGAVVLVILLAVG
ncbi:PH domain-containing protein [Streptomyces sp. V2]|uniref:PH domain-containing protein n=1 Tax=Streptomyces niveiscabiei TaxID=164115 RepID=A0ABW9I473_9ACTN|nr:MULTISPECIES: PH domain-containing protein [Streptomyces]PWG11583.1 PH domain-containing protein [Streptomyces sp. V2]QZZ29822.1 PH domain-containing protein [Streptomyces sp. ST1015]